MIKKDAVGIVLRRPFRDGTTAIDVDPLSLVSRLAAAVPPPRQHAIKYAGVLAAASKWRARVVPPLPASPAAEPDPTQVEPAPPPRIHPRRLHVSTMWRLVAPARPGQGSFRHRALSALPRRAHRAATALPVLLRSWSAGDRAALDALLPVVYAELLDRGAPTCAVSAPATRGGPPSPSPLGVEVGDAAASQ